MRTIMLVLIIACGWLYVSRADYQAQIEQQSKVAQRPICAAKDHLGRQLVASYYAYGDSIQTKRCTYARRIAA